MAHLAVALLGGLHVRAASGRELALPAKGRALLAYLSVPAGRGHSSEDLTRLLMNGADDQAARADFAAVLAAVRSALAGASLAGVLTDGERVSLAAAAVEVDVAAFERAAAEDSVAGLEPAARLYRGDFLAGFTAGSAPFDAWALSERERLLGVAVGVLKRLLDLRAGSGDLDAALATALRLLELDPRREDVHRTVMRLYARQGRAGAALRQYQTLQGLGGQPGEESRALYHEILAGIFRDRPAPAAGARAILLVEDDAAGRSLLGEVLRGAGYDVAVAEDGADALLQLGRRRFDLVVSDIAMPNLDGVQLLEVMHKHRIATPVLFVTGYSPDQVESAGLVLSEQDYIQKPFRQQELLERVRRALARAERGRG